MSEEERHIHVESHGQQGGITAGIVNIQAESQPDIRLLDERYEQISDGHLYETILMVDTQYVVPQIRLSAHAPSIQSLDVTPGRGGIFTTGHTGKREGYHFTTLQNVAGKYRIRVTTTQPEQVRIDLE
ncbi:MAG: hypothetical protein V3U79_02940 [Dehalococcoidia bacterium]